MRDGLPRVRQHLIPVVPAQAFRVDPHAADSYDLIVAHSEGETKDPPWGARRALRKGRLGLGRCWQVYLRALSSENRCSAGPQGASNSDALPRLPGWTLDTDR